MPARLGNHRSVRFHLSAVPIFGFWVKHYTSARGVRFDAVLREAVDRKEKAESVIELPRQLSREYIEVASRDEIPLPLGFEEIVRTFEAKRTVNLFAQDFERG